MTHSSEFKVSTFLLIWLLKFCSPFCLCQQKYFSSTQLYLYFLFNLNLYKAFTLNEQYYKYKTERADVHKKLTVLRIVFSV
jgi:hypothetical protein